jgi:MFS family permease
VQRVVATMEVDGDDLAELRLPYDQFVVERPEGTDRWGLEKGPFTHWERRLEVAPADPTGLHRVTMTTEFRTAIPVWAPIFVPLIKRALRRTTTKAGRREWWMPPVMDARSATTLSILGVFSVYAGYLGVLLSQTNAFFQREFGAGNAEIADAQIAVRLGAFAALAVVVLADRWGRRRVLLASTVAGIVLAATGAFAPNLAGITVSQGVARIFSSAIVLIATVMASEEVPARARAFALSMLIMTAGLGAGGLVLTLWVGDLAPWSWRLFYLVPLPFLATIPVLARRLPETRRFEVYELHTEPGDDQLTAQDRSTFRRRLALVGSMLLFVNLFWIPSAGFTNNYLINERAFSGLQVSLFQTLTNLPGGIALVVGGRLADVYGRRLIGTIGLVGGTVGAVVMFQTSGVTLWLASTVATLVGALTVPALLTYPTEIFPTGTRGRAQGLSNLAAVAGAVIGLKACGVLADRFGSFGPAVALLSVGPALVVLIVVAWFPETSGRELEDLNPGDVPPPAGDELARLDRRWAATRELGGPLVVSGDERDDDLRAR